MTTILALAAGTPFDRCKALVSVSQVQVDPGSSRSSGALTGPFPVNVAGATEATRQILEHATGNKGAHVVHGLDRDDALKNAEEFVEKLLGEL